MHITVPISHNGIILDSFPRCCLVLGRVLHDVRDRLHDFSSSHQSAPLRLNEAAIIDLSRLRATRNICKSNHVTMGGQGRFLVALKTTFAK